VRRRLIRLFPVAAGIALLAGCDGSLFEGWGKKEGPTTRPAGTMDLQAFNAQRSSPALEGTVGSVAYLQGGRMMRVRGFGLVVGLGDKGSRNCRPGVREQVLRGLRRYRSANPQLTRDTPTAEKQLESLDSAVVEVIGDIPAGAAKEQHFDLFVRADDPDTKSLAGGYLIPCELKIFQEVTADSSIEGRTHAKAAGPVFLNPFATASAAERTRPTSRPTSGPAMLAAQDSLREGNVIGGGINGIDRRMSLVTTVESYETVRQIQDTINRRFPAEKKLADGTSPTNVELAIPPEYRERRQRFLEIVMHLPLTKSPATLEARSKLLATELGRTDAPLEDTALALEGIGSSVIPMLQPMYAEARRQVNYYAARTGLRLGDELAVGVVSRHANDAKSPYRLAAVRELGESRSSRAIAALHELLASADGRIRVLAYESLRRSDRESISQYVIGQMPQNFLLEIVPADGPLMIYARRTEMRRLALIGGDRMQFKPPLLYAQPGQPITLSAEPEGQTITIIRKDVSGRNIGPLKAPLSVPAVVRFMGGDLRTDLDGRLEGLGLDYAVVLDVLYRLCEKNSVNAELRWEEPNVEDLVGPLTPIGRPESEL
jgi:flagellar basal body P-ring protein FlgI